MFVCGQTKNHFEMLAVSRCQWGFLVVKINDSCWLWRTLEAVIALVVVVFVVVCVAVWICRGVSVDFPWKYCRRRRDQIRDEWWVWRWWELGHNGLREKKKVNSTRLGRPPSPPERPSQMGRRQRAGVPCPGVPQRIWRTALSLSLSNFL